MFDWFLKPKVEVDNSVMDKSYNRRDMVLMAIEQNWGLIQEIERAEKKDYKTFEIELTFKVWNVPVDYMKEIAREAKKKICETNI